MSGLTTDLASAIADTTLARLRALIPNRPLTYREALWLAERQADELVRLSAHRSRAAVPPVPLEVVASLPRIVVEYRDGMPCPGLSYWVNGRWVIRVSRSDHPRRRRFTVAHEFKHILDHPYRHFLYSRFPTQARVDLVERIAEAFGAALLMPRRLVKQAYYDGIQDVYALARLFEVSPRAMSIRLVTLGLHDARPTMETTR